MACVLRFNDRFLLIVMVSERAIEVCDEDSSSKVALRFVRIT